MDEKVLLALEFDHVLALLAAETATPQGARVAVGLRPSWEGAVVVREGGLTVEAQRYLDGSGALPFGTLPDPEPLFHRLLVEGSVLAPLDVLDLIALMKSGRALKAALSEARGEFPNLWSLARDLPDLGNLIRFLDGKIATTGEIEDRASDELVGVRRDLQRGKERLETVLGDVVSRPEVARALQDDFISIRSERKVIPIRSEARAALLGIVHGISGSGATVFVEPMETVELNNEIVTLRDREAAEVQRLLQEYSDLLRGRLAELRALASAIGRLDLVMARARLGRRMGARPARPATAGEIRLSGARHPLVEESLRAEGGRIVPLDLALEGGTRVLVISGPNTGGKTVALKTIGLLSLMFQSGLMVPAEEAILPVFQGIFIDIGDRQSIADRLSTFSARIRTIAGIVAAFRPPALVLLDEVGTGTDPEEGAALGVAIIDHLRQREATAIATTHLEVLKAYAAETPACANAGMQFDESTLTPTYRLIPGVPGRSGGLEIAEQLGLPGSILEAARARRGRSGEMIASYLARLERLSTDLESRVAESEAARRRLDEDRAALEAGLRERELRQRQAVASEIEMALRSIRDAGDSYLASLKDREVAERLRRQEAKAAEGLRAEARRLIRGVSGAAPSGGPAAPKLTPGMTVFVEGMGVRGTVEEVAGARVALRVRGKRVMVDREECRSETPPGPAPADRGPRLPPGVTLERRGDPPAGPEMQLRGLTVDEALARVDKYLDDAYLAGQSPVRLVHGVGTGRLQRAIAGLLARHPHVEGFGRAPEDEGGAGVTLVRLRL